MQSPVLSRFLGALPDAVAAGFFLINWIAPHTFGIDAVRNGMLIMLVEFVLIHASVFLGNAALEESTSRRNKVMAMGGFAAFYLMFVTSFAWIFKSWWPFVAFGWLLASKLGIALDTRQTPFERRHAMQSDWAIGTMAYLTGVFITVLIPLPRLGITAEAASRLDLPGEGLWVSQPHTVIAFGTIYFALLAFSKWRRTLLAPTNLPGLKARTSRSAD